MKDFIGRFIQETMQIRDLNSVVSLHALLASLKNGHFADSLVRKPPTDLDEAKYRAFGYINMEEVA